MFVSLGQDDARSEPTDADRARNEEILDLRTDQVVALVADWRREHGGLTALIDRLKGGPDVTSLEDALRELRERIDVVPLSTQGRERLLARHAKIAASLTEATDWKPIAATGAGLLILNAAIYRMGYAAAGVVAETARKRLMTPVEKPAGKPRRRRKKPKG